MITAVTRKCEICKLLLIPILGIHRTYIYRFSIGSCLFLSLSEATDTFIFYLLCDFVQLYILLPATASIQSNKMSSPQGQTIGKASKPWTIGRLLGSGACGSVHELLDPPNSKSTNNSRMQYAIKCVNLPPSTGKASTNKKRKKTAVERNADLLLHEYTILQNSGANRGTKFPEIPLMGVGGPPGYGETADKSEFVTLNPCAVYGICE